MICNSSPQSTQRTQRGSQEDKKMRSWEDKKIGKTIFNFSYVLSGEMNFYKLRGMA